MSRDELLAEAMNLDIIGSSRDTWCKECSCYIRTGGTYARHLSSARHRSRYAYAHLTFTWATDAVMAAAAKGQP